MLRIPYLPTAYPDETFGSLLTRLVLYNDKGLWRSLLEECGYGRRTVSSFYAMPAQNFRFDCLLDALGYTYSEMLHQLTILPFWLAFNNATSPRNQIMIDEIDGSSTRLDRVGQEYNLAGARFCPACLISDVNDFGEPYLHRHHQLPVALVCIKHDERLRVTCNACGVAVIPFTLTLQSPPPLRCQCGHDLTGTSAPTQAHMPGLLRLSQFAERALSCTDAPWTAQHVHAILQERFKVAQKEFPHSTLELLEGAYGPMHKNASGRHLFSRQVDFNGVPLRLRTQIGLFRAPDFCALLSATGLTFEEFKATVSTINVVPEQRKATVPRPFTIKQARLELNGLVPQYAERAAAKLNLHFPRFYWLLRLRDSAWFRNRGYEFEKKIPSIESDRIRVDQALRTRSRLPGTMHNAGPWIRSSIRDKLWLEAQRRARLSNETKAERTQRERAEVLSRALFSVLRSEQRPARIHSGLLSKITKMSMQQAMQTIANDLSLQHLIAAINAGKDRRMAIWAVRSLLRGGERATEKDILVRAGLTSTRVNRQLVIAAIEILG